MNFRELSAERVADWRAAGFRARDFFPNRSFHLHKSAPDGYKLAQQSGLRPRPEEMWEIALFALPVALGGLPADLFFDDDIMWHRQHFGVIGQVAVASVMMRGGEIHTAAHQSDLVQRISRRRQYKTRVENRLHGWDRLLLNSILGFAVEHGVARVNVPTAEYAKQQTDRARSVAPELFDRVYDRHVRDRYDVRPNGNWWAIDIAANRERIVPGTKRAEPMTPSKTICVCHDIERGLGHSQAEPDFVAAANDASAASLDAMLAAEGAMGVAATYNVVGEILSDVRERVEQAGHCLGFHTYDHQLEARASRARALLARRLGLGTVPEGTPTRLQLSRCRAIDYRIKGYRPAQSRLGADTEASNLAHQNFEWLASSSRSLGIDTPKMERGIVTIPLRFDDFALHQGMPYEQWEARALAHAHDSGFLAFSLHDCYGPRWTEQYPAFLGRLLELGTLKTLDQIAAEVTLADAS